MQTVGKEFNLKVLGEIKAQLVSKFGDEVKDVILFGSRAKGTEREDSDFDIVILWSSDYDWQKRSKVRYYLNDIYSKYLVIIQSHLLSVKELDMPRGKQSIFKAAVKEGVYA